uniref:Uncharacterized protein n=1 Tax=Nothobranchius kadleci TaxID=1051664 RepID=A0A1A8CSU5_NOTKA
MARIVGATLLTIILIHFFSDRAAYCGEFQTAGFTRAAIRTCRCSAATHGGRKCPRLLESPQPKDIQALKHCLCCRLNKRSTPRFERFCNFPCFQIPTPL